MRLSIIHLELILESDLIKQTLILELRSSNIRTTNILEQILNKLEHKM